VSASDRTDDTPFDILADLPEGPTTTVLEASAGTGKTYALAALVTRYVAEGKAHLDDMLLITFSRAASQELRERVRDQLLRAAEAIDDPSLAHDALLTHLSRGSDDELAERRRNLHDALAGFDAATIATTHQFCQLVLRSLGVAGDTDAGVTLVESLDQVVSEIVDDLYLQRFGDLRETPDLTLAQARDLAHTVVRNPRAQLTPVDPPAESKAGVRRAFADDVLRELERRKRLLGILGFDDLLSRLAIALEADDAPARDRMSRRWSIVMVDEFQDTDPVQWEVIERAFVGRVTLVLIGDPKQAIYAFRGGDVVTYLRARQAADHRLTLATNYRSDAPLVRRLTTVLAGAALGHQDIVVREVSAQHQGHRLAGAPANDPFRLRVVSRDTFGVRGTGTIAMEDLRAYIARDLAADIKSLLASDATYHDTDGVRPVRARDIAVIVESHRDARACRDALAAAGVPAVYTGDTDVFASQAAADWQCLLEAFEQPGRSGLVRAAATSMFLGHSAAELAADATGALTDEVAETLRRWADHARARGIAAVHEAAYVAGMAERVLSVRGGERQLTDAEHLTQLLHEVAHREGLGLPALLQWLRAQREERAGAAERNRRLDSDAAAVQIMTVWVSKGLQYPLVYLPFAFNRNIRMGEAVLYHEQDGTRCLDIGGKGSPGYAQVTKKGREEIAGDDIRLTYVALTRAQSQVVAWWAPSWDEVNGGLSRLLRGRELNQAEVPDSLTDKVDDTAALARLRTWEAAGGPSLERAIPATDAEEEPAEPTPGNLGVRRFDRTIDVAWRRTSYSALIRAAEEAGGVRSEPELSEREEEVFDESASTSDVGATSGLRTEPEAATSMPSPMADLPSGAAFGSLVHGVLEDADPFAPDLEAELRRHVDAHRVWWPVDTPTADLAAALVPLHHTSLGPLADGLTLGEIGLSDRLCELDFEIPLTGGDLPAGSGEARITLAEVGTLLERHLGDDDPLRPYAARLQSPGLGGQSLRGYLSGSIDVVLRVPARDAATETTGEHRYLVVDYKTNWLGPSDVPLTAAAYSRERVVEAMLHSDYPLQALLYIVVVHRYLRWRQPGYDPARHLGGVLYLYVRGMCGPETPEDDGHPAGVFSWLPPVGLVTALSDLVDGVR
jgi:exodeoxyribonuclease V beta subunit